MIKKASLICKQLYGLSYSIGMLAGILVSLVIFAIVSDGREDQIIAFLQLFVTMFIGLVATGIAFQSKNIARETAIRDNIKTEIELFNTYKDFTYRLKNIYDDIEGRLLILNQRVDNSYLIVKRYQDSFYNSKSSEVTFKEIDCLHLKKIKDELSLGKHEAWRIHTLLLDIDSTIDSCNHLKAAHAVEAQKTPIDKRNLEDSLKSAVKCIKFFGLAISQLDHVLKGEPDGSRFSRVYSDYSGLRIRVGCSRLAENVECMYPKIIGEPSKLNLSYLKLHSK